MPFIDDSSQPPRYSRDEVVREVTSFYTFLTTLYIPSSALRFPPDGGWPNINAQSYSFLHKNDTVIDLLRCLPYITRADSSIAHEIYPLTAVVDYEGEQMQRSIRWARAYGKEKVDLFAIEPATSEGQTSVPAHMLALASETNGANGFFFLLNTDRGTMTLYEGFVDGWRRKGTVENEVSKSDLLCQGRDVGNMIGFKERVVTDTLLSIAR